jgi:zinc transporter 9
MYHGVHMLLHPGEISGGWLIWVVLAISLVVDGLVLRTAINEVNAQRGKHSFMEYLRQSSDPTIAAVLLEDGAACFGVLLAMGGIGLSIVTGSPIPDAIATLLIGATMGGIAIWLGYKNRTLILGRAIPEPIQNAVVAYLREQPTIESVHDVKSRIVGAGTFKLKADIDWDGRVIASKLDDWSDEQAERFADAGQRTEALHEYGEKMTEALGDEIDRIEAELKERFPELHHLDLESD